MCVWGGVSAASCAHLVGPSASRAQQAGLARAFLTRLSPQLRHGHGHGPPRSRLGEASVRLLGQAQRGGRQPRGAQAPSELSPKPPALRGVRLQMPWPRFREHVTPRPPSPFSSATILLRRYRGAPGDGRATLSQRGMYLWTIQEAVVVGKLVRLVLLRVPVINRVNRRGETSRSWRQGRGRAAPRARAQPARRRGAPCGLEQFGFSPARGSPSAQRGDPGAQEKAAGWQALGAGRQRREAGDAERRGFPAGGTLPGRPQVPSTRAAVYGSPARAPTGTRSSKVP